MGSDFVDAAWAARHERFEFEFPERTLAGKVILAPGGSGGLGAATVALLAQEGAQVVVGFHRDSARAERLTAALNARGPGRVHCVQGDLRQPEARNRLMETAAALTGEIYGLVSFLGDPARVDFTRLDEEALQESLAINYVTPLLLAR
ncbi:MAG TPA: SDR family NAD(P)-dependent oxidoreductase [Candidatus Acidoferrales bacterium]|nr:SDR family NAD(P)-dependent oxidoreductase [Candidatus Acidoferrales bacterium]